MKIAITAACVAAVIAGPGCKTFGGGGPTIVQVNSEPAGALVRVEGFGECETPCTVEVDKPRRAQVAKAGYNPKQIMLEPGKRKVTVTLELSAPTTGVDETELPEL